ncbi:MAG TPA: hypothetical protein VII06_06120 [Chloroflexota bacterium]|jgi:hypothetical protein
MAAGFARGSVALGLLTVVLALAAFGFVAGDAPAAPLDQAACPPVSVSTAQTGGGGQLRVTVNAGTTTQELRFGEPRPSTNARVSFPTGPTGASGVFQVPWPSGQAAVTFTLSQQALGQPATAQFVVRRAGCPDWPTLAGGGTTGLGSPTPPPTLTATATPLTVVATATATRTPSPTSSAPPSPTATAMPLPGCIGSAFVCAWGANTNGQLGDGSTATRTAPVPDGLTGVMDIAAGNTHSLTLLGDGTVRAWGQNDGGQLGDGTTTDRAAPVPVSGLSGVIAISAGLKHSLALMSDGTVRA